MSWISDAIEGVSSIFHDDNGALSSWVKPAVTIGLGALGQANTDSAQSQYVNYLKSREQSNYQNYVDQVNAYNASLAAAGSGGGGGGGNGAAAAAARATEANRQAAAKKANRYMQKTYKDLLRMYKPYRDTADVLLPQMSQTYQNSLAMQNQLANYVNSPQQVAKLDAAVPAWQIQVPLPASIKGK